MVFDRPVIERNTLPTQAVDYLPSESPRGTVVSAVVGKKLDAALHDLDFAGTGDGLSRQEAGVMEAAEDVFRGRVEVAIGVHDEYRAAAIGSPESPCVGGIERLRVVVVPVDHSVVRKEPI